jgi:hypothetical protein
MNKLRTIFLALLLVIGVRVNAQGDAPLKLLPRLGNLWVIWRVSAGRFREESA